MKKAIVCIGLILIVNAFGFAQKQVPGESGKRNGSASSMPVLISGTKIEGQLRTSLDVKISKVGDQVVVKTTKAIKQEGRTVVEKGSKLFGKVTEVQQKSKANAESRLGLIFDRLEGGQLNSPISASIVSITDLRANNAVGDTAESDIFGSSRSIATTSTGGSGGGLLGGVGGAVGGTLNNTVQTVGSVASSTKQIAENTTGVVGRSIDGLEISNSVDGTLHSGTVLSAAHKNLKVEKGVSVLLQLNSSVVLR